MDVTHNLLLTISGFYAIVNEQVGHEAMVEYSQDATNCNHSQDPAWECWISSEETTKGICCLKMVIVVWRVWKGGYQSQYV